MKLLMISTDKGILKDNSSARGRMIDYGGLFEELHIVIFSLKRQNSQLLSRPPDGQVSDFQSKAKFQISNNVFIYPTNSKSRWLYVLDARKLAGEIIRNSRDGFIVTSQDPFETGLAGWLLAKKYHLPFQIQIHTDFLSPYFWKESLLNKIRVLLAKFLIPKASCIRVVSERIKRSLLSAPHVLSYKITILPIFVDIKKIQEAPVGADLRQKYPQFDFIILMASRLTREKNISLAVDIFEEVVEKYPKTGLIIVGEGPEKNNLELRITSYKLNENIKIEKAVDFETLVSYYKTADLFLLTSNYEGYGRTIVEAMAAGCPVIMTDVGLAGKVLIDDLNGKVVPVNDLKALSAAILDLRANKELIIQLKNGEILTLKNFSPKDKYLESYKNSTMHCLSI